MGEEQKPSMSAFEKMRQVCLDKGQILLFERSLADHLATGIVISTPQTFAMGKAVKLEDGRMTWLIDSAAGQLSHLVRLLPFPLPWIAFCRAKDNKGRLRVYSFDRFIRRANYGHA